MGVSIVLDVMGGDQGVSATVGGAAQVSLEDPSIQVILVGDPEKIQQELQETPHNPANLQIVPAADVVWQEEKAAKALNDKPNCSIAVAARLVASGKGDALVSAGNTGGVILASAQNFNRLSGVRRVGLAAVLPTERRRGKKKDPFALLMDVGATLHVEPRDLVLFALMGSIYARIISKNDLPKVALLSNGAEETKGAPEVVEAHRLLKDASAINFIGNIEGLDIPRGTADVIICEGFLGNVVLKLLEGITELVSDLARDAYDKKWVWKVGLTMLAGELRKLQKLTDWKQYGGAPILGFEQVVIKAHGRSSAQAIRNAIRIAKKAVEGELIQKIEAGLQEVRG